MSIERRQFLFGISSLAWPAICESLTTSGRSARASSARKDSEPAIVHYRIDSRNGAISISQGAQTAVVPMDGAKIKLLSAQYLQMMYQFSTGRKRQELNELARRLYSHLWKPIESAVPSGSRIYIRADGILSQLPFESLRDNGPFVGQRFIVRYLVGSVGARAEPPASGSSLAPGRGLVYAPIGRHESQVRPLESALIEVHRIPSLLKNVTWTTRTGQKANKTQYYRDVAEPFSVLHMATHGVPDSRSGTTSLVLRKPPSESAGEDDQIELLSSAEIRRTPLRGRLVVLAACDSGLGSTQAFNGIASIGEAFLGAGVKEVIAARWKIDDLATLEFMKAFYWNLGKGRDTAISLRAARASMITSPYLPLRHPHFWSPFVSLTSTVFT